MEVLEHKGWKVAKWTTGIFASNVYLVWENASKQAIIVDAGGAVRAVSKFVASENLKVKYIVLTHRHWDHTLCAGKFKKRTGARILIGAEDKPKGTPFREGGSRLYEGDEIPLGNLKMMVMETPGHTPGSLSLVLSDAVFTGDTLFADGVGRTDLKGGSLEQLIESLKKLTSLDESTRIYPGHGPISSIGKEKKSNPFLIYFSERK